MALEMVDIADIEHDIESLVACVETFALANSQTDRTRLLAQVQEQLEKLRIADEKVREELERGDVRTALLARENESAAVENLIPRIRSLQGYLTGTSQSDDPEAHQLIQKAINVAFGYLTGYQNIRERLIGFAAGGILRARPIEGEIDFEELSREHMARYPKIRAALAK